MIPDRSQSAKRTNLTMLAYQQVLSTAPRKEHEQRPPRLTQAQVGRKLAMTALDRIKCTVRETFAAGPLTIDQMMINCGIGSRSTAATRMSDWARRGLVTKTGEFLTVRQKSGNGAYDAQIILWDKTPAAQPS